MAHDPRIIPASTEQSLADKVKALERKVAVLERGRSPVYVDSGPPTAALRRGALYFDYDSHRLWVRGTNTWRWLQAEGGLDYAARFDHIVYPQQFGAEGDGTTNDQAAAQDAINYLVGLGGGILWFPSGNYLVDDLYVTDDGTATGTKVDGIQIVGEGRYNTNLTGVVAVGRQDVDSPNDNHTDATPQTSSGFALRHLTVTGGVELYGVQRHSMLLDMRIIPTGVSQGLLARYCNTLQLIASRIDGGFLTIDGARFETSHDVNCWGVGFNAARKGLIVTKASPGDARATNMWWRGCHFEGNNEQAALLDSIGSGGMQGCSFIGNDKATPGTFATIDIDGGAATADDVRAFALRDNWSSARTSGVGVFIRADRCIGVTIGGGRITNFDTGIQRTADSQKLTIEPVIYDTVTTPVDDSAATEPLILPSRALHFSVNNVPASATTDFLASGVASSGTNRVTMAREGSIVGLSWRMSPDGPPAAGSATLEVLVGGVVKASATISSGVAVAGSVTFGPQGNTFDANGDLGVRIVTNGSWSPATIDFQVLVETISY